MHCVNLCGEYSIENLFIIVFVHMQCLYHRLDFSFMQIINIVNKYFFFMRYC